MVAAILVFSLYLTFTGASVEVASQAEDCRLWTIPRNGTCECADPVGQIVRCNPLEKTLSVRRLYCMTADSALNAVVGACIWKTHAKNNYIKIKTNSTSYINEETCGNIQREGLMCGLCTKDHGLPAYSYKLACVRCLGNNYNWLNYIAVAYLPLTVFFIIIVIFRMSANSGLLVGYVTVSQMVATYSLAQSYLLQMASNSKFILISLFYSIWNLDFFRILEHFSFCFHPNMSALSVLSLDYLLAIYPMVAVFFMYIIVKRFRYVLYMFRHLNKCLHIFKKEWNVKSSLIEAFATLLLLSYVKILNVTFNILTPTYLYNMNGTHGHLRVYNDPHTEYLSKQHMPYFVLAIAMSFVFNFLPFLLICLYPCACFQKCLNWTGLRHPTLSLFMDAFQGSYQPEPFYLRSFPAVYMIAQLTNLLIFSTLGFEYYHAAASLMLMVIIFLVAIARPYKNKWHNFITLAMFSAAFISYSTFAFQLHGDVTIVTWFFFLQCLTIVGLLFPLLYGLIICVRGVVPDRIIAKIKEHLKKNIIVNVIFPHKLECDQENTMLLSY